jgi:glycosyltransferase involved in cell wall biosynthesis
MMPSSRSFPVSILSSTLVTGGAERVMQALVRGLPAEGFAPRVLCLRGPGEVGAQIREAGGSIEAHLSAFRFDPLASARVAAKIGGRRDAILLVMDHHDAIFCGALAARLSRAARAVLSIHSTGLWGKGRSFTWTDRLVLGAYDRVVALARGHEEYLASREGVARSKLRVINNGIDVERFSPPSLARRASERARLGIPAGAFVVTITAALRPEKNHEMLLRAAAEIARSRRDFVFLIVGEGREAEKLQALARELGLEATVRFLGRRGDVADILAATDVSVLCSHPVVETFPLVVLEAMSSGVPVVATDVGSVREMMNDGSEGFIIAAGDLRTLVERLALLARDGALRGAMAARARSRAARDFSQQRMVRGYAELFGELIAGKGAGRNVASH